MLSRYEPRRKPKRLPGAKRRVRRAGGSSRDPDTPPRSIVPATPRAEHPPRETETRFLDAEHPPREAEIRFLEAAHSPRGPEMPLQEPEAH